MNKISDKEMALFMLAILLAPLEIILVTVASVAVIARGALVGVVKGTKDLYLGFSEWWDEM